jgi:hypothetical protein
MTVDGRLSGQCDSFCGEVIEFVVDVEEALASRRKLAASLIFQMGLE